MAHRARRGKLPSLLLSVRQALSPSVRLLRYRNRHLLCASFLANCVIPPKLLERMLMIPNVPRSLVENWELRIRVKRGLWGTVYHPPAGGDFPTDSTATFARIVNRVIV